MERKERYEAFWGYDRITYFRGTEKAILRRLNNILDINWIDTLQVTNQDGNDVTGCFLDQLYTQKGYARWNTK